MKSRSLIALAAVVALASVSGYAQSTSAQVSIPFQFTVGRIVFPAGDYTVQSISAPGVVGFQTANLASKTFVFANRAVGLNRQEKSTLVFNRYGSNYFLARVWYEGSTDGLEFPKSKTEIEVAKTAGLRQPEQLTLMASR